MGRIPMDSFDEGTELIRVYLAATLAESQQVEQALDAAGLEYAVEVETFASPTALGSNAPRRGAGFWVEAAALDACADTLAGAGLLRGLVGRGG
jgi:hypothetical protein